MRKIDILADKLLKLPFVTGYTISESERVTLDVSSEELSSEESRQIKRIMGDRPVK